ncbi:hypothetical protein Afil01_50730 [Actinorhabdospora filicis]|uniref:non-specific serine/threonine protein kinase n=1 Tax=Actinorhabdospora filicis TaxID=1785913 RepID=A0A9W6SQ95_9ACTN|nr:hypothetical protein [Actinorhabdospora filicis]GLZ80266.1 hypothetical protein Afil01_50730 [Actinorhabdospora filicis]
MTVPQTPIYSDDTAALFPETGPDGQPAMRVIGHRPVSAITFDPWAGLIRQLAAHPNIADVYQAGVGPDGRPSMLVDAAGSTLAERLCHTGPLAIGEAVSNASLLALGLDTLHQNGLRHGLVAPSTVLFDGFGRPRLAGLDATAPGLGATAIPPRFNPLDQQPGPATDVYALAATTYVALGGQLPFAHDPYNPGLRSQPVMDLPGVPQQVTGLLRAAMNPDPAGRPSAAQLHAEFSTIELPHVPSVHPALPYDAVGIAIRPVTTGVLEINAVGSTPHPVSGAPAPYPVSGGAAYPVSGTPVTGVPHSPAPQMAAPQPQWTPQPPPPQQQKRPNTMVIAVASVIGVAVLVAAAIIGVSLMNKKDTANNPDPTPSGSSAAPMDEGVKSIDLEQADVYLLQQFGRLVNGKSDKYVLTGTPVYADIDGDNDLDAAGLIQFQGSGAKDDKPWEFVQVWLYDPKTKEAEPLEFEATWQWTCSELRALNLSTNPQFPNTFEIKRSDYNYCDGRNHGTEVIHVQATGTTPVRNDDGHKSAVINCLGDVGVTGLDIADVTGKADPLFLPKAGAEKVAEKTAIKKMQVYYTKPVDSSINHGYAYAVVTFADSKTGCGWVPWTVVS